MRDGDEVESYGGDQTPQVGRQQQPRATMHLQPLAYIQSQATDHGAQQRQGDQSVSFNIRPAERHARNEMRIRHNNQEQGHHYEKEEPHVDRVRPLELARVEGRRVSHGHQDGMC